MGKGARWGSWARPWNVRGVKRNGAPALTPNSHGPSWGACGPSVTGLLLNCHTDFVTHGQIIWHFRFLSLANATALLALVAKKLSETISSWPKLPYGISSWHQQNKHKSPSGASRYTNEAVSLFMDWHHFYDYFHLFSSPSFGGGRSQLRGAGLATDILQMLFIAATLWLVSGASSLFGDL